MLKQTKKPLNMTYILGARCTNGVVLVGDLALTNAETGARIGYVRKIFQQKEVVYGFSGRWGFSEHIRRTLLDSIKESTPIGLIRPLISDTYSQFRYSFPEDSKSFQALIAERIGDKSELYYLGYGVHDYFPVPNYFPIGTSADASKLLLHKLIDVNLGVRDVAKMGYFVIKCIERIDNYIGVGENHPQVYYLPDNPSQGNPSFGTDLSIQEATKPELDEMKKRVQEMLDKFDRGFADLTN